jgi:hypothetical protein
MPRTKQQIEAEAKKVYDKGMAAINEAVAEGARLEKEMKQIDPGATIQALRPSANDVTH